MYICTCWCVCACIHVHTTYARTRAHKHTHTNTHAHTQTHTRTQTHIQARKHGAANTQGKVLDMYHGPHSQQAMFDFIKEAASFRRVRVCVFVRAYVRECVACMRACMAFFRFCMHAYTSIHTQAYMRRETGRRETHAYTRLSRGLLPDLRQACGYQ